jgi:predicted DCC family thiol-disulfide oxidoreductase YuxK
MSLTVWHDGGCPLCRREIALMRRLDGRGAISFIDASDGTSVCPRDRAELLARFHARNSAVLAVLEAGYRGFLRVRPSLQSLVRRFEREPG